MKAFFQNLLQTLFPSTCACCGDVLLTGEKQICINCLANLTATFYSAHDDNHTERQLAGRIPYQHATSLYVFRKGNTVQQLVHAMKFHSNSDLCIFMGRQMGLELLHSGRFDDIDLLVPVPLHWRRRLQRGYNQSELLCRGISEVMGRPVNKRALVRHRNTHQQSMQASGDREENVRDAFSVHHPDDLQGKHLLLVDDVLTTGATLGSCCDALKLVNNLKISIATLSIAH
ncbi:MAG: ComF family protein [Bacteroidales bacterium]|nr:ComF family protein [Bacteroidales bacterium]